MKINNIIYYFVKFPFLEIKLNNILVHQQYFTKYFYTTYFANYY